jgi:hypothetical protein
MSKRGRRMMRAVVAAQDTTHADDCGVHEGYMCTCRVASPIILEWPRNAGKSKA